MSPPPPRFACTPAASNTLLPERFAAFFGVASAIIRGFPENSRPKRTSDYPPLKATARSDP